MTTKPTANRYRIPTEATEPAAAAPVKPAPAEAPQTEGGGYSARQLRTARRVAERHGITAETDLRVIEILQEKGIDPFDRGTTLGKVSGDDAGEGKIQLPQKIEPEKVPAKLEKPEPVSAARRDAEIMAIQRDMLRRRRRNTIFMSLRLLAFVFLPTFLAGYYYYFIATPMYETKSAFQIIKADGGAGAGGIGGLLAGTQFATTPDAIAVQTYLLSKDAMVRLDEDENFRAHFSQPNIDFIQRLPENATTEQAHALYEKMVKIGFDPTEGVVNMQVIAADPESSVAFSKALISYAEQRVDGLSQRKRENQVSEARRLYNEAVDERNKAQESLIKLQQSTLLDPEPYAASLRTQINVLQQDLTQKELQREALLDNAKPNQSRVAGVEADIDRLKKAIKDTETKMNEPIANGMTLAELLSRLQLVRADLATRDLMLKTALEQMHIAETDATSQSRYLSLANNPIAPQDPTYPRAFENTLLAFLIFSGIYLLVSITVAILREQMS